MRLDEYPEQRNLARSPHVCQAIICEVVGSRKIAARIFNRSDNGIYFETDTQINPGTEVRINAYSGPDGSNQIYHACIAWCRELPKDASFFFGIGARVLNQ